MSGQRNSVGTRTTGLKRSPMPARTKPMKRGGPLRPVSLKKQAQGWKRMTSGLKPFPELVATLLDARDECCQRCGNSGPLHRHHRRGKGSGGSENRVHAQCGCNGVKVCIWCHRWIHDNPDRARREGFIVSQSVDEPGTVGLVRFAAVGGDTRYWPDCDGNWLQAAPEAGEAA